MYLGVFRAISCGKRYAASLKGVLAVPNSIIQYFMNVNVSDQKKASQKTDLSAGAQDPYFKFCVKNRGNTVCISIFL